MQEITPISFYDFCKYFSGVTPLWVCFNAYADYILFMRYKFKQMSAQSRDATHLTEKINAVEWSDSYRKLSEVIIENHVKK